MSRTPRPPDSCHVTLSFIYLGNGLRSRSETPTSTGRNLIEKGNVINTNSPGIGGESSKNNSTNNLIKGSKVSDTAAPGPAGPRQRKPLEPQNSVTSEKDTLLKETIKGI